MSTQTPFECIDSVLHKYNHGLNSDYNGEFLHCMRLKSNGFDENDIEYELGRNRDPTQCSYVWRFRVVIPSYVHIPRGKEGSFTFYILQYAYLNKECPSKSYIQHLANTLLHKPNSDDRLPQICDACIDLVIDTEDPQLADHPRSIRFQQSARDMKIISCICNEETSPETCEIPLIQLVAILKHELPQTNALLQNLRKRYMIPKGIAQLQWFQDSLQRVVSRWNQKKNVKRLDYHTLHALFVNHSISENYHSDHVVHCLYTFLIKNGYKTSRSAVERIWNAMDPSQDDYRSNKLCDELLDTNICKVKDWKEQYVHGYIHETLLPQGHIDERIRNWGDYTRKWLCVLGEHVITKYKDKNDVRIEITNYNLHRNEQPIYVVKEGSKHYLKTASQLANAPSLPKRPPKPLIIPDEKQRDDIVDVWKSGEGCKVWMHGTIKWNQMPIYGTQNQAMSYICTYNVGEFEKQIKRFIEGNPQIRIEPVPRFDRSMWEWLIDWVLIVGVDCCMPSNETCECDIGIAVYALNGELHPTAIYLSIYDRQRLWGMDDTQDTFREIHNLRIGGSCKALVKDQRDKPKFL